MTPRVTAVVLAYGDEPLLTRCVASLLASSDADVDVVLVDNGCTTPGAVDSLAAEPRVTLLRPGHNLGYAGGCNAGAAAATGEILMFVNADAVADPGAAVTLARAVDEPRVGLATGSVRLLDEPDLLNAAGNPLTIAGVVWAGHFREPATSHRTNRPVAVISGAAFAARREVWDSLGGFDDAHFAYHEDTDLSVRAWQRGYEVVYVADAVVLHRYEFSRNPRKHYLLERNRLLNLAVLWQARTLLLLAPALVAFELAVLATATVQGWLPAKLDGYRWLWVNRRHVRDRRRRVQAERRVPDRDLVPLLTPRIAATNVDLPPGAGLANALLSAYWAVVRRLI